MGRLTACLKYAVAWATVLAIVLGVLLPVGLFVGYAFWLFLVEVVTLALASPRDLVRVAAFIATLLLVFAAVCRTLGWAWKRITSRD